MPLFTTRSVRGGNTVIHSVITALHFVARVGIRFCFIGVLNLIHNASFTSEICRFGSSDFIAL